MESRRYGVYTRNGCCLDVLRELDTGSVDLTVTSPPYDNLRDYEGYSWDFESIAIEISRVTKNGGIIVWIVGDATINGSETGSSFRQALFYKDVCGLRLHDTMIWNKGCFSAVGALRTRYAPVFEYMFILSKGAPKTFNPIKDRDNKHANRKISGTIRNTDGSTKRMSTEGKTISEFGQRFNVWEIPPQRTPVAHPAPFPLAIARDHIVSWSNPGDLVLDPFMGSGTTGVAAVEEYRGFFGVEISSAYHDTAVQRIKRALESKER